MLRELGLPVALRDRQFFRPLGLRGPFTCLDNARHALSWSARPCRVLPKWRRAASLAAF
jgi:hypothetical protein